MTNFWGKLFFYFWELGINFEFILEKTSYVLIPRWKKELDVAVLSDGDITGPLVFMTVFGCLLLLVSLRFFLWRNFLLSTNYNSLLTLSQTKIVYPERNLISRTCQSSKGIFVTWLVESLFSWNFGKQYFVQVFNF